MHNLVDYNKNTYLVFVKALMYSVAQLVKNSPFNGVRPQFNFGSEDPLEKG